MIRNFPKYFIRNTIAFVGVRIISLIFLLILSISLRAQVPTISSFSPTSGPVNTSVIITGTNFDVTPTNNVVHFGATKAVVSNSSATELTVNVPFGASYQPITVAVNGLLSYSSIPFVTTFDGAGVDVISLADKVDISTGIQSSLVAMADLDDDGKADLIVLRSGISAIEVYRNISSGVGDISFDSKESFISSVNPVSLDVGDFDGDGKIDVVVVGSTRVGLLRNINTTHGVMSFDDVVMYTTTEQNWSVSTGDFDMDGKADLAVTSSNSTSGSTINKLLIYRNTSSGIGSISYATPVEYTTNAFPYASSVGDFDNDGKPDIAVVNEQDNTLSIYRNTNSTVGTISFAGQVDFVSGDSPISVSTGDLDEDGKLDLAVANAADNTTSIFRNSSSGVGSISFDTKVDHAVGLTPRDVAIGDMDGDGKLDLSVANRNDNTVSVLKNITESSGLISLDTKVDFATDTDPRALVLTDIDGDGRMDMAVPAYDGSTVSILRNTSISSLIAYYTFNGDATDQSGNANDGSASGATLTTDRFGNADAAYSFDGVDDVITLPFAATDYLSDAFTLSAWVYRTKSVTSGALQGIVSSAVDSNDGGLVLGLQGLAEGNRLMSVFNNDASEFSASRNYDTYIPEGEWILCTATYDGSMLLVYENSDLVGSSSASGNLSGTGNLMIGSNPFNGIEDEFFGGSIDDVRIYDYALTETEVYNLYDIESGDLIVSYTFDGDATDNTGNGYDGTVLGALDTQDRFGSDIAAFAFDGDDRILATGVPISTQEITIMGWFNTSHDFSVSYGTFLDLEGLAGLFVDENNLLGGVLQLGDDAWTVLTSDITVNDGAWHHGTVTYNGSQMILYLDGVEAGVYSEYSGELFYEIDPLNLRVGYSSDGEDRYFNGDIDDIRYYSRALSASEISEQYLASSWVDDRAVLMSLYYNTDGDNWSNNTNWGTNEDLSTWYGVTAESGVVSQLDLSTNNLVGEIPSELGNLSSLIFLNLFNNGLSGSILSDLGNLSNLQELYLSVNDLSGDLPASLGNLSNATIISFSRNRLSGAIPSELVNLSSLSGGLFLYSNEFTSMPDMTAFPTGTTLSVYDNKIGFADIETNLPISSGSTFIYSPQTSGNEVTLYPAENESLTLFTTETYTGTTYQWYYNDEEISGANLASYTFNFTSALEGTYYVQMTNSNVPDLTINGANLFVSDGVNVAPNTLTLDNTWVEEGTALGTYVGVFSASDVDPEDTQTYTLVEGEGDTDNAIFTIINENQLRTASNIFATDVQYSIRVRVTDSGGEFLEVPFDILVNPLRSCNNETFTALTGSITDGSGEFPYNNNFNCSWTVEVPEGNQIKLDFNEFDLENGFDFLQIYDGSDDQATLLAQLTGSVIPEFVVSSSNVLHIVFITDTLLGGDGWSLDYSTVTPVAYYPFDGDATDATGNGNDGVVTDATLANDRYGNADASYNFNGTSAYIQTGTTISSNAPFTVSTWVRWDGNVTNYTEIVSWWNEASPSKVYLGTSASTGELRFGDAWINTGVYLIANQWENLVATYDGSVAKIYLNGELVATSSTNPLYDMSSGDLFVGRQGTQSGEFFGGAIDDIAIYDIALPASLISALYNDAGATDLFAYLPFRNSLEDASDNGFDGFQFGSSNTFSSDRVASPNDAAYNFEYENTDLVELSNTANYDFGDEITVTAWIRPDTYPTEEVKLISNVFEGKGFELRLITGDLTSTNSLTSRKLFADIAGISYGDIGEILLDRWTHVAFKYQRGYGASIYINGQNLITYGLVEGFEDSPILISPINVQIGNGYDGILDEVKIFKSALTDDEILLEYNEDVWPFDVLALRGPDPGEADDNFLYVSAANSAYYNEVLDITKEGMYQFRATNTSTTLFEAFMGDNEGDGVAEPGGVLIDLTTGIYGISFNVQNFEYFIEQVNTIGFIGSARTGDEDGWLEEDEMVDLGNGIYQIQNIKLFDGEWKLRMNNQWGLIDWGYSGTEGELFTFGNNIPILEGTYTITVDIINNKYYVIDTEIEYVAELAFDGDLLDTSGYENHGTGTLAFTTDRFGDANSAIDAQSVNIGSDAELNLSNGFSLNMWINPYSYDNNAGLFLSGNSFHQHLSEFDVAWRYFQDGTEKSFGVPLTAPINTWTMFTWVYDGGEMRFYDDGLLVHTEQVLGDIDTPGNSYEIGVGFDGSIDDFIWAKGVLDEYDILSLYNDGYVARYALDGGAIDEVNGYDGILNGSPTFGTDRFGSSGLAISLDGVDDYIDLGTDPTLHFEDEISLSAWVKADGSDPFGGIVSWSIGFTLDIRTDNGGLATFGSFGLSNDVMNSTSNIQDGEWHHLVGTYGEGIKRLYVDGVLEAELIGITLSGTDPFLSTFGMTIGWEANSGYFEGQIDDVGIFDRAITGEEVLDIYSDRGWPFSANQVAYYTFTDGVTTSETGSYDGVATSNSLFSMDRFGQFNSAFEPEGNGGNISISHGGAWDMTGEVMLNGWVRPNQFPTGDEFGHIIFRDDVFGELDFNSSGELFYHWDTGGGNYSVVSTAADQIKHNQWNMVTLVISDADYVKIYVNGDLQKISQFEGISNADSILITRHSGVGAMAYLGSNLDAGSDQRWISGSIDDFRVYVNGSFSSNQILELYENELSGGSDELVAFFPFNGSSLSDESGNQYGVEYYDVNGNEIAANFTTDRYGETDAALLFDNTGNNAPVFHERSINLRNDFTVNLWINPASFITTGGDELGDVLISDSNLGRFMTFGDGILAYHYPSNNGVDYPTGATAENVVSLNTWQMVTYSINNNDQLSIYHNGVKLIIDNSDVSDHQINLPDRFVIAQRDNAGGSDQRYYDGAIDDVGVYQRTLSDAEVEALYIAQDPFSSEAAIISFSFPSETGAAIINSSSNTIDIEVAIGTDLTNLVADFTISDGASVTVDGVNQVSNTTSNDFTGGSLTYTVTSRNGQVINEWVVSVSRLVNTDTDIVSFKIADQVGDEVIDVANHTILINMPFETDPSSLTPTIELPFGATINPGSDIAQNFTNAFFYTVTAEDNNISQAWEVTVEVATISNEAPIIAAQTFDQLEENSAISTAVGTVVASDPDGDALTFSITGGTGSDIFTINASSGELLISDASKLNYEENPSFSLNVSVSDGALSTSAEMTINLVDVNDPATITNIVAPDSYTFGSGGLTISADIIDEDAITDVSLFYKKASEADFSSKQMDVSDNNYSQTLTGTEIGLIAIEYYIQITNATGTEETESQTAIVERPTTSALSIDDKVTAGNSVSNYSILAFPFLSATVSNVFGGLGTYDDSKWRLLRYNGTDYTDHKTGSLSPGTGYFFITTTEATIEISGTSVRTTDGEFALPLSDEYSLIGNPFQGTVNWSEVLQYNIDQGNTVENQVSDLIKFSNGVFVANQTSLSSLEGAFVKSDGAVSGFVIPVSAVTDTGGGRVAESLNAPEEVFIDNTSWNFDLFLETPDYTYSVGGIGMHQNANDADDALDLSPLPRFHIYIDVLFEDGNTRSVKETDRFKKWEFNVPSNLEDKYINMSWDIPVSTDKTIILVDGSSQQIYDLSQKRGIELLNDPSATHQLYFGNKEEIFDNLDLPFDAVFNLYPNPVRDYLNIELYAAEGRTTKVEFVSIDGKVAYTQLVDLQQGLNKKEIDLVGKSLAEGVYLIKIDAKTITKFIKL